MPNHLMEKAKFTRNAHAPDDTQPKPMYRWRVSRLQTIPVIIMGILIFFSGFPDDTGAMSAGGMVIIIGVYYTFATFSLN